MNDENSFKQTAQALLIEATSKLIALRHQDCWKRELPPRCPPILWFGDADSGKEKLLTIGANPSRQEYLGDSATAALQKVEQSGDDSLLSYLQAPKNRFRLLSPNESLEDIFEQEPLRAEIIAGYTHYFEKNPYRWFGLPKEETYNVECFLRGMNASYYRQQPSLWTGIHIDLFPFATLQDFTKIQSFADADLFASGWAQQLVTALVKLFEPRAILVFGRTNFFYFAQYFDSTLFQAKWKSFGKASFTVQTAQPFAVPLMGLSTNLGNPIGFNRQSLGQFAAAVAQEANLVA